MTQPGQIGPNWSHIVSISAGSLLVPAFLLAYYWLDRRRRTARQERPPQQEKLLRPAGHFLQGRLQDLSDWLQWSTLVSIVGGGLLALLSSGLFPVVKAIATGEVAFSELRNHREGYLFVLFGASWFVSLVILVCGLALVLKYAGEMRNCRFGLRGEQAVAEALMDPGLAAAGYKVFHDVPGNGRWNIDHVIVGLAGVFVLETKTRPRRKPMREQKPHEVLFDGGTLQFPWCDDPNAAAQVERNARWVRQLIADYAPKDIVVQPVIVVPGWFVESQGNYPVKAMNAKYLVSNYLPALVRKFTPEQLRPVIARLDDRCRDLEF